ncbi:pentatricopeptide repeat-containing protein At3g12770-like isoform X2 [Andrographis paniculata]|nr:pentatricopeptide repeat-containing protein At3g12770-like isoform X2 [Andrographis paniculata]XP_051136561.1 pentatricopeptide repeat-containing protein At3g12770-like isoform X2 [Andrographis paniculata]
MAFTLRTFKKSNFVHRKKDFYNFTGELIRGEPYFSLEKFASHLENCTNVDSLRKLHACLVTRGLEYNGYLGSKLIHSLARFAILTETGHVFDKVINGDDIYVWNSAMVGYFKGRYFNEVLGLYLNLRRRNIRIGNISIVYGLKSCMELGIYEFGTNLQSDCFKFGVSCDQFVCSSLIGFYSKFDRILDASKVFDEMPDKDVVAYTSLITAYARSGNPYSNNAFTLAIEMQRHLFKPNRVMLVSLLQSALQSGALDKGRSIHGYAIRRCIGFRDEIFEMSLMKLYLKLGDTRSGCIVFDRMKTKIIACWNALISGMLHLGRPFEALTAFNQMAIENHKIDLISLSNGLVIAINLGHLLLGKAIHGFILRKEVNLDLVGTTTLIDMYGKCRHLSGAVNVFNQTCVKDGVLFSIMLAGYLYNGFFNKTVEMFRTMVARGLDVTASTIINVLCALSELKDIDTAKFVHGCVFRQGMETNTDIANQLISMYSKCNMILSARVVFDTTRNKDRVTWTSIIQSYVSHGHGDEAISLFWLMQRACIRPDCVTFTCLIQAASHLKFLTEVHARLYRTHMPDVALTNSLITAYGKWGKIDMSRNLFKSMVERQLSSWNTMIAACGMTGNYIEAMELFTRMKSTNLRPDEVTFKSVLSACSHAGYVQEGLDIFNSMKEEYGIIPTDEHYGCVVDMLGRAGHLEEAYDVVRRANNGSTLGALLAACRIHGDSEMGERVGKWLLEVEPGSASAYCSVSNMYAVGGRWDAVASIGAVAKEKGLRRATGYSLVDVN